MGLTSSLLKLVSLNIEGQKHINLQVPFFKREMPDVLCLQEVFESDFLYFKRELAMEGHFAPMCKMRFVNDKKTEVLEKKGVAILSRILPHDTESFYYYIGDRNLSREFVSRVSSQNDINKVFLYGVFRNREGESFTIGTTHFTWAPEGGTDDLQRRDIKSFLAAAGTVPELVFCGDFNAPRGKEIFGIIAEKYKDNIPAQYMTSIDGGIHRAGNLNFMVDGLFSTPEYSVENVKLVDGVSDHCAIVAHIGRSTR